MDFYKTYDNKKSFKNGIQRFIISLIAIIMEVALVVALNFQLNEHSTIIELITRIAAVLVVLLIYSQHRTASIKMSWIILIMAAPIFGLVVYFLIGTAGSTRDMSRRYRKIDEIIFPMLPDNPEVEERLRAKDVSEANLARYLRDYAGYPVYDVKNIRFFSEASDGLDAMIEDMKLARHYIFMEYHAIEEKESFFRILKVLSDKVEKGVEVRIFYDDMGSIGFINTDFVQRMEKIGIKCRVFNPFFPGLNVFLNNRDHRKITVIDGVVAYTGGYNIANEYFNVTHPYGHWKDTGIRVTGDAVKSFTATFLEMWNSVKKRAVKGQSDTDEDLYRYLPLKNLDEFIDENHLHINKDAADPADDTDNEESAAAADISEEIVRNNELGLKWIEDSQGINRDDDEQSGFVQPYADSPMDDEQTGENVYAEIIDQAQNYIYFITPYLIITEEMIHNFKLAARRGVDVRIITPGIPDKKLIYQVTRSYYNALVRNGIRIYEYTPGFCHAKMCVSDDKVATCGTINLDYRSLYHHFENGCVMYETQAVKDIKDDFEQLFPQCRDVTEKYNHGRGRLLSVAQLVLRLLSPLL